MILLSSGGSSLNRLCVAERFVSGFHVTQISESSSRTVGISFCHALSDTPSASSTHARMILAFDLMLSRFRLRPAKT